MALTTLTLVVMANLCACGDIPPWGGPCEYADTPGTATIVSVESADPDELNCSNDPVVVIFDFEPGAGANPNLAATGVHLRISEGLNPPREWVENEGLTVGSQHACLRRDIVEGTCTPLVFEFTEVDYEAGIELCYAETTFDMTVFPVDVDDSIYLQQIVVLAAVEDYGFVPAPLPVHITAVSQGPTTDITVEPEYIYPGQVCEVTVIPLAPPPSVLPKPLPGKGDSPTARATSCSC